jgi:hypothetical protein
VLQVGDGFRNHWAGNRELVSGFRHVASLGHGEEDVQVPRLEPPPDAI